MPALSDKRAAVDEKRTERCEHPRAADRLFFLSCSECGCLLCGDMLLPAPPDSKCIFIQEDPNG